MIPTLFAATSVGVIAFIAAFHMTDAFVLRERSIAYGYSVASEVRSGGIQLAVLRSCSSRPAECIDGWREVPSGLVFYDYLGRQGREPDGWLALPKSGRCRFVTDRWPACALVWNVGPGEDVIANGWLVPR